MESLKGAHEEFEFQNVQTCDKKIMHKDVYDNKIKTYYDQKIIFQGLLEMTIKRNYLRWKSSSLYFVYYLFVSLWTFLVCLCMQLLFTSKYFLSITSNAPLIFCFELIFCDEAMPQSIFLISLFLSCYYISVLETFLMTKLSLVKHIYILSCLQYY